jgi:hypothetical protein
MKATCFLDCFHFSLASRKGTFIGETATRATESMLRSKKDLRYFYGRLSECIQDLSPT